MVKELTQEEYARLGKWFIENRWLGFLDDELTRPYSEPRVTKQQDKLVDAILPLTEKDEQ